MRKLLFACIPVALCSFMAPDGTTVLYTDDFSVAYQHYSGMITGNYTSFWPNGKIKATGDMDHNRRIGEWQLFDSMGVLLMSRTYIDPWTWTLNFPKDADLRSSAAWIDTSAYGFRRFNWSQQTISKTCRLWRYVPYEKDDRLFAEHKLIDSLIAWGKAGGNPVAFSDDELSNAYSPSGFLAKTGTCDVHHVLGYRIKEDWLYDNKAQTGLTEVVSICPVVLNANGKDSVDLGWYDYALIKMRLDKFPSAVYSFHLPCHSIHEEIVMHCFFSEVYKVSNRKTGELKDQYSPDELPGQVHAWGVRPYEWEHNFWLEYYSSLNAKKKPGK